jgi:hypothetical protein
MSQSMVGRRNPCLKIRCIDGACEYRGPNKFACVKLTALCEPNPCRDGRLCTQVTSNYVCTCPFGSTGDYCREPVLPKLTSS